MHSAPIFHPSRSKYLVFTADYILPTLICLLIFIGIYLLLYSPFFRVNQINCILDYRPCDDPALLAEVGKLKDQNIFTISAQDLSARLTSGDFTIRDSVLTKKLPSSIQLDLHSVYPVVALRMVGDSKWVILDAKYRFIALRETDPNVPTVIINSPLTLKVGQPVPDELVVHTLDLALQISRELVSVKSISLIDENTVELELSGGVKAYLTPKKEVMPQLRVLQAIIGDATMMQAVHIVDVRFARPVLRP